MSAKNHPIGLFDSGVGGLTVAHALHTLMPDERMIYYGDTAHLPYGDKSRETIVRYSLGISDFLLEQGCKIILIACNTASSNAYLEVQEHVGDRALVLNVIDPIVEYICSGQEEVRHIGIIGTKATIGSESYEKKIQEQSQDLRMQPQVSSLATPLLVPMIEEGFVFDDISNAIIRAYLSRREMTGIDTLILGCTHYPIIRNQISRFFNFSVNVLDTAQIVAMAVKKYLTDHDLRCNGQQGESQFYISDHTPFFEIIANMFFNEKIRLEKKNIWK
jgi:glutamate racemase